MSEFVVYPAHVRGGRLVKTRKTVPETLTWDSFCNRFSPGLTVTGIRLLRQARHGSFVGVRKVDSRSSTFVFNTAGRSTSLAPHLRRDPMFERSILDVCFVDKAKWDGQIVEQ